MDSNRQPSRYERDALTVELSAHSTASSHLCSQPLARKNQQQKAKNAKRSGMLFYKSLSCLTFNLEPLMGLEPTTYRLQGDCSAD